MVIKNLWRRKTRTFLTIIGIAIGVAAVVALGAIAEGMIESYASMLTNPDADITVMHDRDSLKPGTVGNVESVIIYRHDDRLEVHVLRSVIYVVTSNSKVGRVGIACRRWTN